MRNAGNAGTEGWEGRGIGGVKEWEAEESEEGDDVRVRGAGSGPIGREKVDRGSKERVKDPGNVGKAKVTGMTSYVLRGWRTGTRCILSHRAANVLSRRKPFPGS